MLSIDFADAVSIGSAFAIANGSLLPVNQHALTETCLSTPSSFEMSLDVSPISQTRVHGAMRGSFRPRGGGPGHTAPPANWSGQGPPPGMSSSNWHYLQNPDKEPPPGYVCFRCGQKGRSPLSRPTMQASYQELIFVVAFHLQATGFRLVRRTRTQTLRASPDSSGRRVSQSLSSRRSTNRPTGLMLTTWASTARRS